MNWENLGQNLLIWGAQFGVKILDALSRRPIEPTFINYLASASGTAHRAA
jgi:hypothetical protein